MNEQLQKMINAKAQSEIKHLHDELRNIRHEYQKRGLFTSSGHVNAAIRACSDYVEKFVMDSLVDYKRAMSLDKNRFSKTHLDSASLEFFNLIEAEFKNIDQILDQAVGGIAKALSNKGMQDYKSFDKAKEDALQRLQAEVELFNAEILNQKPTPGVTVKKSFQENIFVMVCVWLVKFAVGVVTVVSVVAVIPGAWDFLKRLF